MSKAIENLKSGNYEVVDNQGVSVAIHFVECLEKEFADLEAKLVECEKDRLMWQDMYKRADKQNKNICETDIYPLQEENQQLKDKLEIKMEELHIAYCAIENVKTKNGNLKAEVKELKQQLAEKEQELIGRKKLYDLIYEQLKNSHQDKISFAIQKLEKIKREFCCKYNAQLFISCKRLVEFIENELEELKKTTIK